MLISLCSFYLAHKSFEIQHQNNSGILFVESVKAKSAPGESALNLFEIHQGVKFSIIEQSGIFSRIRLENGNEGWIRTEYFKTI